jgi:hypothetical protein
MAAEGGTAHPRVWSALVQPSGESSLIPEEPPETIQHPMLPNGAQPFPAILLQLKAGFFPGLPGVGATRRIEDMRDFSEELDAECMRVSPPAIG